MEQFTEAEPITVACLALLAITVTYVLWRTQKNLARSRQVRRPPSVPQPEREPASHHQGPNEMLRWDVAMHETARDLSAQLDSKLGLLQHLVREADRAAARLEAALQTSQTAERRPESRASHQAEALRSTSRSEEASGWTAEKTASASSNDDRYQEIYTLADYGYPSNEIAQRLGSPVGEIELILSLRKQR